MQADRQFVCFLLHWHGMWRRSGLEGLRRTVAQLQGIPVPISELESSILPARLKDYAPQRLDRLIGAGEVLWQGEVPLGQRDGQIALYLKQAFPLLGRISVFAAGAREQQIRDLLAAEAGLEFGQITDRLGGFADDLLNTLWKLVWNGEVTSDSLDALRTRYAGVSSRYQRRPRPHYATGRRMLPGAAGRWKLLSGPRSGFSPEPERELAQAAQLLDRYGILNRETLVGEGMGLDRAVPLLEQLEARALACRKPLPDRARTGDLASLARGAEEVWRKAADESTSGVLSACDPANPFGLLFAWPRMASGYRPQRLPGARVFLERGELIGYLTRTGRGLYTPENAPDFVRLIQLVRQSAAGNPIFLESVNGKPPYRTPWHRHLVAEGFSPSRSGYLLRSAQ